MTLLDAEDLLTPPTAVRSLQSDDDPTSGDDDPPPPPPLTPINRSPKARAYSGASKRPLRPGRSAIRTEPVTE